MSEQFQEIILKGQSVSSNINLLYLITVLTCSFISFKIKKVLTPLVVNTLLVILSMAIANSIFGNWWTELKSATIKLEDQKWLTDRESGLIMIQFSILFKAFASWLVTLAISILLKKKRTKALEACQSDEADQDAPVIEK